MPNEAPPSQTERPQHIGVVVIHGNGEAEPGWINPSVIDRLQARLSRKPHANRLDFEPDSHVYDLPDKGGVGEDPRYKAYVRHGRMGTGPKVTFAEFYWADLSRVSSEPIFQVLAALRLFYEAPNVLTRSFLEGAGNWFHTILRGLIAFAIWMVRWLVAGLNGMLFITLLATLLIQSLWEPLAKILAGTLGLALPVVSGGNGLAVLLMVLLVVLGVLCAFLAMRGEEGGYGLSDVWIATGIFSALGFGALLVLRMFFPEDVPKLITDYLKPLASANFLISFAWDAIAAVAVALFLLLSVKRAVVPAREGAPPLSRIGAAIALAIIQAQIWKICVPAAAALTINALDWHEALREEYRGMTNVGVLNSFLMALDLVLVYVLMRIGGWLRGFYKSDRSKAAAGLPEDEKALRRSQDLSRVAGYVPRVIISWLLVALLGVGPIANLYQHYLNRLGGSFGRDLFTDLCRPEPISACIAESQWLHLVIAIVGLVLVVFLALGRLQALFMGVLHFGRDIVDHQYKADLAVTRQLRERAQERKGLGHEEYPRRERIRRRLDTLMWEIIRNERFDRLIFLTHSQGSVIAHDCLVSGADNTKAVLAEIPELHVVTLGSPITHLYQFYFTDYEEAGRNPTWVPLNLRSWTNMWRIDDPIADEVFIGPDHLVSNVPLEPGGHEDYWKEPQVCDLVLQLLELPRLPPAARHA